jgi:hypothetical protein
VDVLANKSSKESPARYQGSTDLYANVTALFSES